MGREFHEHSDDVEFESHHHPGCMGGIFNVLHYHRCYNVKKMFPHRDYKRDRRHTICCANPQTISMEREPIETQGLLHGEADEIQVRQQSRKTGSTNKNSGKEKPKEGNWILGFSARPQLQQTDLTHHLEPSGFGLGWMNPIILVRKRAESSDTSLLSSQAEGPRRQVTRSKKPEIHADNQLEFKENSGKHAIFQKKFDKKEGTRTLINQKPVSKKLSKEISCSYVKESVDVLEILKVNKDLFLDILQDPEVGISQHFPGKQTSKTVKLTKSGSFPVSDSPRTGYLRSSTLEHKQKEVWSFRKGEKSLAAGSQSSKSRALNGTDDSFRSIITEEASSSSQGSDSQKWNHLVMNRLKEFRQRIKQALKGSRKSINHTRVHGLTFQVSSNKKEMFESSEKTAMELGSLNNFNSCLQTDGSKSDHDISNGRLNRIRRTKSINESLNRYTQLFEQSVSKETHLHHSKSLKLTNEVPSRGRAPKIFRKISSLSDLKSFCSLLHLVPRDALSSETPIWSILNYDANKEIDAQNEPKSINFPEDIDKFELVEAIIEAELQEKMREGNNHGSTGLLVDRNGEEIAKPCDFNEDIVKLAMEKISPHQEQENVVFAEGQGLNHPNLPEGEAESFTLLKDRHKISHEGVEYETMGISSCILVIESDKEADPCYNYVRDTVELSGFIQHEYLQAWYSPDQPLNLSLFKELETLLHPEQDCSIEEVGSNCDRQLVLDLVNKALLEINEKSSIYFPKPFSFNCRISLMLKGNNVLQEVWTKVNRNLASQPEPDQSLNDIVARDLEKDGWMNLQAEAEFVALELEDLVFDELLDEIL